VCVILNEVKNGTRYTTILSNNPMITKIFLIVITAATLAVPVRAQNLEDDPGYLDLSTIESWFGEEATLEVNIEGALLRMVSEASRNEDPELSGLLTKLRAIQVRGYSLSETEISAINQQANEFASRLERTGWDMVARVRDDDERVHMFVRTQGDAIAGLVVMVVSPGDDETVFVNIVGDIDPAEIGRIGSRFDIGPLDGVVQNGR
jgi:hypothetical protein